jgi:hypothetical protein
VKEIGLNSENSRCSWKFIADEQRERLVDGKLREETLEIGDSF